MAAPPCQTCAHTGDWHPSNGPCDGFDKTTSTGPPIRLCGCTANVVGTPPVPAPFICPVSGDVITNAVDAVQKYCPTCDGWTGDKAWRLAHWEVGPSWARVDSPPPAQQRRGPFRSM